MEVTLGKRTVESITPAGGVVAITSDAVEMAPEDRLHIKVDVTPRLDRDWLRVWESQPYPMDLDEPDMDMWSAHVRFTVARKDLDRAWQALSSRVAETNQVYASEVVPARLADAERRDQQAAAEQTALEAAQRELDALS